MISKYNRECYRKDFKDIGGFQQYFAAMNYNSIFYKFYQLDEQGWSSIISNSYASKSFRKSNQISSEKEILNNAEDITFY